MTIRKGSSIIAGTSQGDLNLKANNDEVVHLTGTETISGNKVFTINPCVSSKSPASIVKNVNMDVTTSSINENAYASYPIYDKNDQPLGSFYGAQYSNGARALIVSLHDTSNQTGYISINWDPTNGFYTVAPTPDTSDNSTKIATTAFVKANDTKNTAGSTDTSSKIFLIGATSQEENLKTYSHDTVYINTSGQLVSSTPANSTNSTVVATTAFVKSVLSTSGSGLYTISKAANGYCKFNGGLIVQWFSCGVGSNFSVTFPTAFTSASSYGIATASVRNNGTDTHALNVKNRTKTGFTGYLQSDYTGAVCIAIGY